MLDAYVRKLIDPPLDWVGAWLNRRGVSANRITVAGLAIGVGAVPCLAVQAYGPALALIALNRLCDGLDGAVARHAGITDFGGYLDIVADFLFYGAVVFGFALGTPDHALAAAFLILSFVGTGTTFLAFAIFAAKHDILPPPQTRKSLYYLGGLTEGTETITAFVLFCIFPQAFVPLAVGFGMLCWLTTGTRIITAWQSFGGKGSTDVE